MQPHPYDAVLVLSFGGPEGPDEVMPYLDRVLKGRRIPEERKLEVAHHYQLFGGKSPLNEQNRRLIDALRIELDAHRISLPIYFGNRNWHPLLPDTVREMAQAGIQNALAFATSAFSSYSGCRQYRENIYDAREACGSTAPMIDKIRVFYNHPGFIEANAVRVADAFDHAPSERQSSARLVFTAHSIPCSMAETSSYQEQLRETCRLTASMIGREAWDLVYQSRSGPPHQPWLEPDICDYLERIHGEGVNQVVIAPIGFVSDHMEILYDLDTEAREVCERIGLHMVRAETVGHHPAYVSMIRQLIEERLGSDPERKAIGEFGPYPDMCPEGCCAYQRPGS